MLLKHMWKMILTTVYTVGPGLEYLYKRTSAFHIHPKC